MTTNKSKILLNPEDPDYRPDNQASRHIFFLLILSWILFRWKKGIWLFGCQKKCPGHTAAAFGTSWVPCTPRMYFWGWFPRQRHRNTTITCRPQRHFMQCTVYSKSL